MLILASAEVVDQLMAVALWVTESAPAPQVQPRSGKCTTRQGAASPGGTERKNQIQVQSTGLTNRPQSNDVMFNRFICEPMEDITTRSITFFEKFGTGL